MLHKPAYLAALACFLLPFSAGAQETPIQSSIESVELFKNGLAIVHRSLDIPGPGVYRLDDVPAPVHGTFWVSGDLAVDTQVTMRDVDVSAGAPGDIQQDLVGKDVKIQFKEGTLAPVAGRVVRLEAPKGDQAWGREYEQVRENYYNPPEAQGPGGYLVVETDHGRTYVDMSMIASMDVASAGPNVHQRRPVLLLTLHDGQKGTIHISYLTRGLAWAPSYRVDLLDGTNLSIEQQAVVKNEMQDFKDTEVELISGFPNIQFAHVVSPLSLEQNWEQFFQQINTSPEDNDRMSNAATQVQYQGQSGASGFANPTGLDMSASPGEGSDLHYQSIGKRSMAEGDSLMVSVATGKTTYDRIVEWTIPDIRDADGRPDERDEERNPQTFGHGQPWDAVRFKNPLPFPMTTAPAMIVDGGHFAGQSPSEWVDAGEETTLHITKALSIRTRSAEWEGNDNTNDTVDIGAQTYRKVHVNGELDINNHRADSVNLVIRRQFSGDLVKAEGDPKTVQRSDGDYSVNRRNELVWTIPLKAGEEKTLTYEYLVLIAR